MAKAIFGKAPEKFSFDWILKSNENRKAECENFYSENNYDVVLLRVECRTANGWKTKYEVGNPLLGGIKTYSAYNTADKYFFELVGRIHIDALAREEVA